MACLCRRSPPCWLWLTCVAAYRVWGCCTTGLWRPAQHRPAGIWSTARAGAASLWNCSSGCCPEKCCSRQLGAEPPGKGTNSSRADYRCRRGHGRCRQCCWCGKRSCSSFCKPLGGCPLRAGQDPRRPTSRGLLPLSSGVRMPVVDLRTPCGPSVGSKGHDHHPRWLTAAVSVLLQPGWVRHNGPIHCMGVRGCPTSSIVQCINMCSLHHEKAAVT